MENSEEYGPALPPAMQQSPGQPAGDAPAIGPTLPSAFVKQEPSNSPVNNSTEETSAAVAAIGPGTPQDTQQQTEGGDSEGTIGPLVSEMSHGDEVVQAAEEFERRSRKMKDHLTVKAEAQPGPNKREEWMTELPPEMGKNFGLTARTFSNKGAGSDDKDRSEWTDTPADKAKKEKEGKSKKRKREEGGDKNAAKQRDQQLQQQIDEYNKKKRPESLVEMHQKQKKKKKKKEKKKKEKDKRKGKEEKQPERRPFDRDEDLKVNRFDDAQRKALIKRSQELNTKFSHSHTSSSFL